MVDPHQLRVPLVVTKIDGGVPPTLAFIPVSETETEDCFDDPESSNEKAHLLFFLNSRHCNDLSNQKKVAVSNNAANRGCQTGGSMAQRQKTHSSHRSCNRIFSLTALTSAEQCARSLTPSKKEVGFLKT